MRPWQKYGLFTLVAGAVVLLDQLSKAWVLKEIPLYRSVTVIPGFFSLTHVLNPGGAFGFFARNDSPMRHWFFLIAAIVAMALIVYFYHQTPKTHRALGIALAMIFGGAVGNVIDRLRFGKVVDFLDVFIGQYHWPTFNVADSAVVIGVAIFILHIVFKKMPY